jgi:hypothetical protein
MFHLLCLVLDSIEKVPFITCVVRASGSGHFAYPFTCRLLAVDSHLTPHYSESTIFNFLLIPILPTRTDNDTTNGKPNTSRQYYNGYILFASMIENNGKDPDTQSVTRGLIWDSQIKPLATICVSRFVSVFSPRHSPGLSYKQGVEVSYGERLRLRIPRQLICQRKDGWDNEEKVFDEKLRGRFTFLRGVQS